MPLYAYKGFGQDGKSVSGVESADSPKALRQAMRRDGVMVMEYSLRKGKGGAIGGGAGLSREVNFGAMFNRIKKVEVANFTRQLATLLHAGIPLAQSLTALYEQAENVKLKSVLGSVRTAVNEGSSFADAAAKHPHVFEELYVSMVRAGETAGNLDGVLTELAEFLESSERLKGQVMGAMMYPMFMMVVGFGVLVFLMVTVIPNITEIFNKQDQELPLKTQFLIATASLFVKYWFWMLVGAVLAIFLLKKWLGTEGGRAKWDKWKLDIPLFGPVQRHLAVARFSRTMGTMLNAGVPMLRTLDTSKEVLENVVLTKAVARAKDEVTEGDSLAVTLQRTGYFPPTVIHMVSVGEQAGALESMLLRVADAYDREVTAKLGRFTSVLGPAMILAMSLGIGFMVFAVLEPLLELQQMSQGF